jgi:hypothetical protein
MNSSIIRKALTTKDPSISREIGPDPNGRREGQAEFQRRLRLFEDEFTCLLSVI